MVEDTTFLGKECLIERTIRTFLEYFKETSKANRKKQGNGGLIKTTS